MKKKISDTPKIGSKESMAKKGIKTIGFLASKAYSYQKSNAKGKSELTFIGEKKLEKPQVQWFVYDELGYTSKEDLLDFSELAALPPIKVGWFNIHGLHDVTLIGQLTTILALDRLTLRQLLDTTQRPKVEEYDNYIFFTIKSILPTDQSQLKIEHISFILNQNMVVSFQEEKGDHFGHIRDKIKEGIGFIRKKESEYLLAQLLDAILDNYFETIDNLNTTVDQLEKIVLNKPIQDTLVDLERARKDSQVIRKSLTPFMEALNCILNDKIKFIGHHNLKYFRDLQNNCASAIEEIDSTAKSLESLTNIYFSSVSHKMNETMKVLTTVSTIFIPLTFIVGIYGMNFHYMPELTLKNGYFIVWGVMILIVTGMIIYFRRKGWL